MTQRTHDAYTMFWDYLLISVIYFAIFVFFQPFRMPLLNLLWGVARILEIALNATSASWIIDDDPVANDGSRIHQLAIATGYVRRIIVFGSFVTAKPEPNDVDIFIVMDDEFEFAKTHGETRLLFEHGSAHSHFGASVFWLRQLAAYNGVDAAIADWQIKRDGKERGIVEIKMD